MVVASAIKWKSVYIHLVFWVTTVYFALCFWNKLIKTESLLTNSKLTCDESKKYQYAMNFTPSKLLWLMVTSKTCWDTETFLLACITGVLSEANTPFRANCVCLAWLIKRLLCRLPLFKEVRTCRKTFEILRAKQTCQKRNSVLYTWVSPKSVIYTPQQDESSIPTLFHVVGALPGKWLPSCKEMTMKDASIRLVRESGKTTGRCKTQVTSAGHCFIDKYLR